jgi:hypothetical protein
MSLQRSRMAKSLLLAAVLLSSALSAPSARAQELAPPPPLPPSQPGEAPPPQTQGPTTETTEQLEKSEKEDSGRGLEFFYANAGVRASGVGLATLNASDFAVGKTSAFGAAFDAGLGLRLLIITFGPRVRYHLLNQFDFWQLNGEVAIHIPISRLDLYVGAHGGYSVVGAFTKEAVGNANADDVRVRGFDVGLQIGIDYYLSPHFSLGGEISGEILAMSRPALATTSDATYGKSGGAVGVGGLFGFHAGLHF